MKIPEYLSSGEIARLIPVSTKVESRNTSVTCAILMAVDEFADAILGPLDAPTGKRSKTTVILEPVFKVKRGEAKDRPDALIIVDNGRRQWRALVEAKAKTASLEAPQIEKYLDIARDMGIDAVITISNQFVVTPSQSPCQINKQKLKKVKLFHWSWSYLETEAKIQLSKSAVSDPDQAYILEEYVRFLVHDSAGVNEFEQMGKDWVEACKIYFAKSTLDKSSPIAQSVISDWDELMRSTALFMSRQLDTNVTTLLSAKERNDPSARLEQIKSAFLSTGVLECRFDIPGAASPISVEADLSRRSMTISMKVQAPGDKKRASATVTWLVRQLNKTKDGNFIIFAKWPSRIADTHAELSVLREDPEVLVKDRKGQMPHSFEIKSISDLGGKFTQRRNFVSEVLGCVKSFYDSIGQYVVPWQAPPPKPKKTESFDDDAATENQEESDHNASAVPPAVIAANSVHTSVNPGGV